MPFFAIVLKRKIMKKTKIIKKNYEFQYFFKKGKYYPGKYLEIFIHENNKKINKLGIVVSKKVGKSVVRNKIKRLIRESYYKIEENINNKNIIISWKKSANIEEANYNNILNDLISILKKTENNEKNIYINNKNI